MTFIVTLIALLIERFFDWSHLRNWSWYAALQRLVSERLPVKSPYLILLTTIIPLLLVTFVIQTALKGFLYGFIPLLFQLFILLYCLGPRNLWADAFACINALIQGDVQFASEKLKKAFGITDLSSAQSVHEQLLNAIFIDANRRVFALVFWFVILGPVGAVLYRAITLSASDVPPEGASLDVSNMAKMLDAILNWVPVRIFTFLFALGGNFVLVLSCWRKNALLGLSSNDQMLVECGRDALGNEISVVAQDQKKTPEFLPETAAIGLLDRVFVISLVIIAIVDWVV